MSRLASLGNNLTDANDLSATFAYNPASQIASTVRTGDMYAWTGHADGSTASVANGLNQVTSIGGSAASYDSKGNLTADPTTGKTYAYSSENLLTSASGGVTLAYDPLLRLYQVAGAATTRFAYDGLDAIAEYNGSNALQRRFVFDPTTDAPVVWYEGSGTAASNRRYLSADERGSVISVSDSAGASLGLNTYDEYGKPGAANLGRYQYTGQAWIPELGLYYYKARLYAPHLGRFLQPDPIGYVDSPNLYNYVLGDPVNLVDPLGLCLPGDIKLANHDQATPGPDGGFVITRYTCVPAPVGSDAGIPGPIIVTGKKGSSRRKANQQEKHLPACAQSFLRPRISGDPSTITLHDRGSVWNAFDRSVTYGTDIYLVEGYFEATGADAMHTKFHEIGHVSQNLRMGLNPFDHAAAYALFGSHNSSPLELSAEDFADRTYAAYKAADLDKTCPF